MLLFFFYIYTFWSEMEELCQQYCSIHFPKTVCWDVKNCCGNIQTTVGFLYHHFQMSQFQGILKHQTVAGARRKQSKSYTFWNERMSVDAAVVW